MRKEGTTHAPFSIAMKFVASLALISLTAAFACTAGASSSFKKQPIRNSLSLVVLDKPAIPTSTTSPTLEVVDHDFGRGNASLAFKLGI